MGFRTIDLDQPGGYQRYEKLRETKSVKETFKDLDEKEQKSTFFADDEKRVSGFANEAKRTMPGEIIKKGVVTGVMQLRVREKPEGDVISMISEKTIITILDEHEGWYKVEYAPDKVGYVMKQYIKEYKESIGG